MGARNARALALAERDATGAVAAPQLARSAQSDRPIAQGLIDLRTAAGKPVVVLSDNAIDHALLMLARMHIGRAGVHGVERLLPADEGLPQGRRDPAGAAARRWSMRPMRASMAPRVSASGIDAVDRVRPRRATSMPGALSFDALTRAREGPAVMQRLRRDRARRPCQVPADLGVDRPAQGRDQHAPHAVRQPADDRAGVALPRAAKSRSCSTGCRGATPSAATTTSTWCCATAARCTSTKAGRRRG